MAKSFEKVLTDAQMEVYEDAWQIDDSALPGFEGPPWSITKFTLVGGKQHGVDMVEIDNGEMTISAIPTRGMNVLEAGTGEVVLGFDSPVREVVHPAYVNSAARGGLGFLEGFGELMCRCGLESHGAPGPDVITDNTGAESTVILPLHGTISNTPASRVWVNVQASPPHRLSVWGEVYDTRMFGPSYMLRTCIWTVPGASEFTISDQIFNVGGQTAEMELLYHCNFGRPLLGKGSRLVAPVRRISARDERALEGLKEWDVYDGPRAGYKEQCYMLKLHGDRRGRTAVALVAPGGETAANLRFALKALPAFTLWKNTAAEADGYVTGLEPGSDYPNPRSFEREKGRVVNLPPDGCYAADLTIGLVSGKGKVAALRAEIAAMCKGKKTQVCAGIDSELAPT